MLVILYNKQDIIVMVFYICAEQHHSYKLFYIPCVQLSLSNYPTIQHHHMIFVMVISVQLYDYRSQSQVQNHVYIYIYIYV